MTEHQKEFLSRKDLKELLTHENHRTLTEDASLALLHNGEDSESLRTNADFVLDILKRTSRKSLGILDLIPEKLQEDEYFLARAIAFIHAEDTQSSQTIKDIPAWKWLKKHFRNPIFVQRLLKELMVATKQVEGNNRLQQNEVEQYMSLLRHEVESVVKMGGILYSIFEMEGRGSFWELLWQEQDTDLTFIKNFLTQGQLNAVNISEQEAQENQMCLELFSLIQTYTEAFGVAGLFTFEPMFEIIPLVYPRPWDYNEIQNHFLCRGRTGIVLIYDDAHLNQYGESPLLEGVAILLEGKLIQRPTKERAPLASLMDWIFDSYYFYWDGRGAHMVTRHERQDGRRVGPFSYDS